MRVVEIGLYCLLMAVSMAVFKNTGLQNADWTYPYFSGAEHLNSLTTLRCSVQGYYEFRDLPPSEMFAYDFRKEKDHELKSCSFNDIGYVFVVYAARHLFPFLSHINAAVALQCLVHVVLTLLVAFSFDRPMLRAAFVLGYGANPLIIHVVTFAYSYFWQVLPSFLLVMLLLEKRRGVPFFILMYALLFLSYLIRPSVLPLIALVAACAIVTPDRRTRLFNAAMALVLAFAVAQAWQPKPPWHTMYVGLGAYENPHVSSLSDLSAFALYKKEKNIEVTSGLFDSTFYNAQARDDYYRTIKEGYLEILRKDPGLVVRNSATNLAQSFSVGYFVRHPGLRVYSIAGGLAMLLLLLYFRQYFLILAILTASIGFVLYYPPIPAYMFGSYLVLAFGAVRMLEISVSRRRRALRHE